MKYLQKFNESKENYITQSDFELIENLFLFWSDEKRPINYLQFCATNPNHIEHKQVENSIIDNNCEMIVISFLFHDIFERRHTVREFDEILGADPLQFFASDSKKFGQYKVFQIENQSNLYEKTGPFPNNPKTNIQKFINLLDAKFNIKKDAVDILNRTKGLEYYGFRWSMYINSEFQALASPTNEIFTDFSIIIRVTK